MAHGGPSTKKGGKKGGKTAAKKTAMKKKVIKTGKKK
jgi:hypothetical protein